jgi:hypothetical protein
MLIGRLSKMLFRRGLYEFISYLCSFNQSIKQPLSSYVGTILWAISINKLGISIHVSYPYVDVYQYSNPWIDPNLPLSWVFYTSGFAHIPPQMVGWKSTWDPIRSPDLVKITLA